MRNQHACFFTTLSGRLVVSPPFTALRKVSMYSMSRYWVAAVITVRVRILLSFRLDEHCWNAALLFVIGD